MINRFLSEKVTDWHANLFIIGIVIILFSPYLFRNPAPLIYPVSELGTDLEREILPTVQTVIDGIKESGTLPLWATYHLSGRTLVGHPIAPLFYPPNWLLLSLPLALGINWLLVLHFAWMGIGFYYFLTKGLGKPVLVSLFVALLFVFTPKWLAHVSGGHWWMIAALAWWPWVLYAYYRWEKDHRFHWILLIAIALSAQFLCHLSIFLISVITIGIISLFSVDIHNFKLFTIKWVSMWCAVFFIMACLTAIHWMPLSELIPIVYGSKNSYTFTSLPPITLLTTLIPGNIQYPEWVIYPGMGLLFLSALNGRRLWTDRKIRRWGMIGLLGLFLSLGDYTPLYNMFFGWNPGISLLRIPSRWWLLVVTSLTVLSTISLEEIVNQGCNNIRKRFFAPFALLILNLGALLLVGSLGEQSPFKPALAVLSLALFIVLLILPIKATIRGALIGIFGILEAAIFGFSLIKPISLQEITQLTSLETRLVELLSEDERFYAPLYEINGLKLSTFTLNTIDGYDPLLFTAYANLVKESGGCAFPGEAPPQGMTVQESNQNCFQSLVHYDWLAMLNVRYLVLPTNFIIREHYNILYSDNLNKIIELPHPYGRVSSSQEVLAVTESDCLTTLGQVNLEQTSLIINGTNPVTSSGKITLIESNRSINGETFRIDAPSESFLVRSEVWAPGWKAMVDDQPVTVLQANCALQGVWVPQGRHTITFYYYPDGYKYGKWISIASLIILVIYVLMRATILKRAHN